MSAPDKPLPSLIPPRVITGVTGDDVHGYEFTVADSVPGGALPITPVVPADSCGTAGTCCPSQHTGVAVSGRGQDEPPPSTGDIRYGPAEDWAGWWFAEQDPDEDGGALKYPWRPVLQLDGMVMRCDGPWFATEQDCLEFIRDNVIPRAGLTDVP